MRTRVIVPALVLTGVLAACGGDDDTVETLPTLLPTSSTVAATTTTAAPPTTVAPTTSTSTTSTTTTVAPTTTSTTVSPAAALVLRADALGDAVFGADPESVIDYVRSILGPPTADSGWADPFSAFGVCPGTEVRGVTWDDLTLLFSDDTPVLSGRRHFFSYVYGPAFGATIEPVGMRTDLGIGVGSTVGELRFTYPDVQLNEADFAGPWFAIEDQLTGGITGTADTDVVISVVGGYPCGE